MSASLSSSARGGDEPGVLETPSSTAQLPPSQPPKSKRKRLRRPERGSLFHTLREHPGLSLFVRPLCWTDLHTKLLKARFEELPPCSTPLPSTLPGSPPSKGHMQPSETIITLSEALTEILTPSTVHPLLSPSAVRIVLNTLWPNAFGQPHFTPDFHLYFGGRVYCNAIRIQLAWGYPGENVSPFQSVSTKPADSFNLPSTAGSGPSNAMDSPMLCYMSKNLLASIRKNLFRVAQGPQRSWNEPVWRLQQLRSKLLTPANSDQDAYLVGVFLAMAQRHFYATPPSSPRRDYQWLPGESHPPQPEFRDLKLRILSHDTETAEFLLYTAHVTAKFLERFHHTHDAPKVDGEKDVQGLKIEYTRVPIWPILGLRERLGKALGEDVVGPFDPEEITTWEEDGDDVEEKLPGTDIIEVQFPDTEPFFDDDKDEAEDERLEANKKRKREALSEVFNGSFDSDSEDETVEREKRRRLSSATPAVGLVV